MTHAAEIYYRLRHPARGHFPGAHRSNRGESGYEFRGHARLVDAPDVRRLDLRASLRDPFGDWQVRVYSQRRAIEVQVVADLSASMAFSGEIRRLDVLADLASGLAASAWRAGDRYGFIGCGERVDPAWLLPATRSPGAGQAHAERLRAAAPGFRSAHGLLDAHQHLGRRRALVFLVSDFHFDLTLLDPTLQRLAHHDVVPVVLWDRLEAGPAGAAGLLRMHDAETGSSELVWWRPALRRAWQARAEQRRAALGEIFQRHRLRPLRLDGHFDADAVTRHFVEH